MSIKAASDLFSLLDYLDQIQSLNDLIEMCFDQFDGFQLRKDERVLILLECYQKELNRLCDEARVFTYTAYESARSLSRKDS